MGLTRFQHAEISGEILFEGRDLLTASDDDMRKIRGNEIAMIFQDPLSSLHPFYKVGKQMIEGIRTHYDVSVAQARERSVELLGLVGIPSPRERMDSYPHEFSGGMRQRAMIAMALANEPKLLIADEPTTALDVTIQAQILDELRELRESSDTGIILVTHDLGVVADIADRIVVMYAGRVVEQGTLDEIFYDPQHPYTWGLLGSITRVDRPRPKRLAAIPGRPPSLIATPEGCHFRPRCPHEFDKCKEVPPLEARIDGAPGHKDRCWLDVETKRKARTTEDGQIGLVLPRAGTEEAA
jgi:oligopeptide/dipeptide ABC transporter ATP-binding protein